MTKERTPSENSQLELFKEIFGEVFFVASLSGIKVGAGTDGVKALYQEDYYLVEGRQSSSDINEQPIGVDETLLGAENRLRHLEEQLDAEGIQDRTVISFENGLFPTEVRITDHFGNEVIETQYIDQAFVIVKDRRGRKVIVSSMGVQFPKEDFEEAQQRGFDKTTVGQVMAERLGKQGIMIDPADPHVYLTNGRWSRRQLLSMTIEMAFAMLYT